MSETWSEHDSALWYTCEIVADAVTGQGLQRPPVPATFALSIDPPVERLLATGRFELDVLTRGNGSYGRQAAWGPSVGPPSGIWRTLDAGAVFVGTHGCYLVGSGFRTLAWQNIVEADLVGTPGVATIRVNAVQGQEVWRLRSVWAELLFVLWALAMNRNHPRLLRGDWLPRDFEPKVQAHGYAWADTPATVQRHLTLGQ